VFTFFALPETLKPHTPEPEDSTKPAAPRFSLMNSPVMILTITLALISSLALANMEATFAIFADDVLSLKPSGIGLIFAVMGVIGVSVQFVGAGPLSKLLGEQNMALMALCFLCVGMFIVGSSDNLVQALIGMCVIATGFSTINPALSGLTSMAASGNSQGAAMGLMQSASSLGRVVGPALAGVIYDFYGPPAPFYAAGGILLITIVATVLWLRRRVSVGAG
jgi:predicted MFS family arabinose efflux permease